MKYDPFTLLVALDRDGSAGGDLYLDDGDSYAHEQGQLAWRQFYAETAEQGLVLASDDLAEDNLDRAVDQVALPQYDHDNAFVKDVSKVRIERIVVLGLSKTPKAVRNEGVEVEFTWEEGLSADVKAEGKASVLVIKNPGLLVVKKWGLFVEF
jgi:alpha 1,3-glucosidase